MSSQGQSGQQRFGQRATTFNIYTNVTTHTDYQGETKVEAMEEESASDKKTDEV
jgi:hypothetical protein